MRSPPAWVASDLLQTSLEGTQTHLKGALAHDDYAIRVDEAVWAPRGEALLVSDRFFVQWTPSCSARIDVALSTRGFRRMGTVVFLPPSTSLGCRWQSGRSRSVSCSFAAAMLEQTGALLAGLRDIRSELMLDVADPYVEAAMLRISEEVLDPGLDSEVTVGCLILSLGGALHRRLHKGAANGSPRSAVSPRQLGVFTQMLHEWDGKLPPVPQLAARCELPLAELARSIKLCTGLTMRGFIARERLSRAKALLRNDTMLIKQVSFQCGFANPAAFAAAFRKSAGITPAEYRLRR